MVEEPHNKKFTDRFKTFQFWFLAVLGPSGLISAVIGLVKLIQGNLKIASIVLFVAGMGLLYAVLFYVTSARASSPLTLIFVSDSLQSNKYHRYSKRVRGLAWKSNFALSTLLLIGTGTFIYDRYRAPVTLLVLVADFSGPDLNNYRVTETIIEQLRRNTEKYADITVRSLGHSIDAREGSIEARKEGAQQKATIVLWGWYGKTNDKVVVSVNFEVLQELQLLTLQNERHLSFFPTAQLESFQLQTELSSKTSYAVLAATGLARFEAKDFEGAIERFSDALNQANFADQIISPAQVFYLRALAYLAETQSDLKSAMSDCNDAIEYKRDFSDAYLLRGLIYAERGLYEPAISECDEAIKSNPNFALAYLMRGLMWEVLLEPQRARSDYELITRMTPHDSSDSLALALAYWRADNLGKAMETSSAAIEMYPDNSSAFRLLNAQLNAQLNNFGQAVEDLNDMLARDPNQSSILLTRADVFLKSKDVRSAINDCYTVLKANPRDTSAYFILGQAHDFERENNRSIIDYTNYISLAPDSIVGYIGRAGSYQESGSFDKATSDYTQAIQLAPRIAELYTLRGFVYFKKKAFDHAIADYNVALSLKTGNAEAYYYRGETFLNQKKFDEAIEDFGRALKLKPDDVWSHLSRGLAFVERALKNSKQGDSDGAVNDFDYIVNHYPDDPIGYTLRSSALMTETLEEQTFEKREQLRIRAERDLAKSKTLFAKNQFDIDQRNRISRLLGIK